MSELEHVTLAELTRVTSAAQAAVALVRALSPKMPESEVQSKAADVLMYAEKAVRGDGKVPWWASEATKASG